MLFKLIKLCKLMGAPSAGHRAGNGAPPTTFRIIMLWFLIKHRKILEMLFKSINLCEIMGGHPLLGTEQATTIAVTAGTGGTGGTGGVASDLPRYEDMDDHVPVDYATPDEINIVKVRCMTHLCHTVSCGA